LTLTAQIFLTIVVRYYLKIKDKIFLLEIFSKNDLENICDEKILNILKANDLI